MTKITHTWDNLFLMIMVVIILFIIISLFSCKEECKMCDEIERANVQNYHGYPRTRSYEACGDYLKAIDGSTTYSKADKVTLIKTINCK